MKKALSFALALVMYLGLLPTTTLAADKVEINWLPSGIEPLGYIEESDRVLARNGQVWYLLTTSGTIDKVLGNLGSSIDISVYYGSMTFASGMQSVAVDGKGAFIDGTGKVVLQTEYEDVYNFSEGMAQVTSGGLYGFIDETGKTVVPLGYNEAKEFSEGLAAVRIGDWDTGKCGFIDKTGKIVIPFEYEYAESFSEGLALVTKDGKSSFIDKTGKTVMSFNELCESFSDGRACVYSSDGTANYIDKTGKVVFSVPDCEVVRSFSEGLVQVVNLDYGTRFMDVNGNTVFTLPKGIVCQYFNFTDGVMPVLSDDDDGAGLIDKTGTYVITPSKDYAVVEPMGPCLVIEKKDGSYGICKNPGYTAPQPEKPAAPATAEAMPTNDKLTRDGEPQDPTVYKIGDSNYFKIRDLAAILNGTGKQFSVGYDSEKQSVTVTTGEAYTMTGTELKGAASSNETAQISNDAIYVNGQKVEAEVYKIGGNNYFKLRDLGKALDFYVGWSKDEGMYIDSGRSYDTD